MEYITSFDSSSFNQLNEPPMAHVSSSVGHYIFLIGGYRIKNENDNRTIIAFDKQSLLYYDVLNNRLDTVECSFDSESIRNFPTEFFFASGITCCSFENRIYLFGGYSLSKQEVGNPLYYLEITKEKNYLSNILDFAAICNEKPSVCLKFLGGSHDGMSEETHKDYPSYRDKSTIVYWKNNLIVFGGYGSNFRKSENQESDPGHNFLADNGQYIPGSGNRGWTNQLLMFSLVTKKWKNPVTFGSIPCPRAAHSATMSDNKMFVFGGRLGVQNTAATIRSKQFYYLDLITFHWTELILSDLSIIGRSWTTLTAISHKSFFIIGGFSGENVPLSDAFVVKVDDNCSVGVVTKKINCFQRMAWESFVTGKIWNSTDYFNPLSRMWHSASLSPDGRIYVIGGCQNNIIFQVEQIQSIVERVRPEPSSLYQICLWNLIKLRPLLNASEIPNQLIDDLLYLSI